MNHEESIIPCEKGKDVGAVLTGTWTCTQKGNIHSYATSIAGLVTLIADDYIQAMDAR